MAGISISYLSKYGNGKKAMEYLAGLLSEKGNEVELFSVTESKPDKLPDSDLYVFSTSVHMGKPPGKMRKYVRNFDGKGRYALVVTHVSEPEGERFSPPRTIEMMNEMLQASGLTPICDTLLIRVKDMKGPLEDGWEEKIANLAEFLRSFE